MILRNTAGQGAFFFARVFSTGLGQAGDSANITGGYSLDGVDHVGFATAHPTEMAGGVYWQPLAQAETDGDAIAYRWASSTSGVVIDPVLGFTGGVNIKQVLGLPAELSQGTAQAGASTSITLASSEPATANFYVGRQVTIVSGTAAGQARFIVAYDGSTKIATVHRPWDVTPDSTSQYTLDSLIETDVWGVTGVPYYSYDGVLAAATSSTVTLPAAQVDGTAIPDDGSFANTGLYIYSGTGADQFVVLTTPTGTSRQYNSLPPTRGIVLDSTSHFVFAGPIFSQGGVIAAATSSTVTLPGTDSLGVTIPDDGRYANTAIYVWEGTGQGQLVLLTAPTGTAHQYGVVASSMPVPLDGTSKYYLTGILTSRQDLGQAVPMTNTAQTVGDALNAARAQGFGAWAISGQTLTLYGGDGTTAVRSFTLDAASAPTTPRSRT